MERLVALATTTLGTPPKDHCFCLKLPGVLGGDYAAPNLGTIALSELLQVAGKMARQIRDVPDGGEVILDITE